MNLNINNLKKKTQGFTIIEVLIVLAIAGLILLVVFLAVPALQRNQRNNGRASEASRLSTAVGNFIGNNQGTLPGMETGAFVPATAKTDGDAIVADFGTFKYFTGAGFSAVPPTVAGAAGGATAKMTVSQITMTTGPTTPTAVAADGIVIDDGAVCGPPSTAGVATTAGTARQVALIYTTESSGGNYNQVCIQAE